VPLLIKLPTVRLKPDATYGGSTDGKTVERTERGRDAAVPVEHIADGAFAEPASGSAAAGSTEVEQQAQRLRRWLERATADDFDSDPGPGDPKRSGWT